MPCAFRQADRSSKWTVRQSNPQSFCIVLVMHRLVVGRPGPSQTSLLLLCNRSRFGHLTKVQVVDPGKPNGSKKFLLSVGFEERFMLMSLTYRMLEQPIGIEHVFE